MVAILKLMQFRLLAACALPVLLGFGAALALLAVTDKARHAQAAPSGSFDIQAAINAAPVGGTVFVPAGIYTQSLTLNRAVSLTGALSSTTIIRAQPGQRVITVTGAAISNTVVISGLTFAGGQAAVDGGGMYVQNNARPRLVNLIFTGNHAGNRGGAIGAQSVGPLALANSRLISNTSQNDGAGIYSNQGAVLTASVVQSNTCLDPGCEGGAVFATSGLTMTGSSFISNTAQGSGGAARVNGPVQINGGQFLHNRCLGSDCWGGMLYNIGPLAMTGAQVNGNQSQEAGGALFVFGAAVLNNVVLQDNRCHALHCYAGGAYVFQGAVLTGTQVLSNHSSLHGAGLAVGGHTSLSVSTIQSNTCVAISCTGAGLYAASGLVMVGGRIDSNTSQSSGGGAYVAGPASLTFGVFSNNRCLADDHPNWCTGGGLYVTGTANVNGTLFLGNTSRLGGGGLMVVGAAVVYGGASFTDNACFRSLCRGGGLEVYGPAGITATTFTGNSGRRAGAANITGPATIHTSQFIGNHDTQDGAGALFVQGSLDLRRSAFLDNRTGWRGGALWHSSGSGYIANSLFAGNTGQFGAAVFLSSDDAVIIEHTTIASPTVGANAAILVFSGAAHITNTLIASYTVGIDSPNSGTATENYNLFSGVLTNTAGAVTAGANSLTGTAAFRDPASADYHIRHNSAALDVATPLPGFNFDFEGDPRPLGAGPDIGYDEAYLVDVRLSKTAASPTALAGGPLTYSIVISNVGSQLANAFVSDSLDLDVTVGPWTCAATPGSTCPPGGVGFFFAGVTLLAGGSAHITLTATAPQVAGVLSNTALLSFAPNMTNFGGQEIRASAQVNVVGRLYLPLVMR